MVLKRLELNLKKPVGAVTPVYGSAGTGFGDFLPVKGQQVIFIRAVRQQQTHTRRVLCVLEAPVRSCIL